MDEKPRIMIVDDNPRAGLALSACLSTFDGFKVICEASNGEEAIRKVESQTPDVILMDVQMPVMDGLEATRAIKEHWPQIKVIVLTIYADSLSEARQAGADAFLIKGCSTSEMITTMQALFRKDEVGHLFL